MPKPLIITVHGINSGGEWQEQLEYALHPHFEFAHIKYDEYRFRGETKLLVGPIALAASIGATLMLLVVALSLGTFDRKLMLLPIGLLALGYVEAVLRRRNLITWFKREIELRTRRGAEPFRLAARPPHIVAHSLGTFLIGMILRLHPDVRLGRVILAGCVLPYKYDWEAYYHENQAFNAVRNEVGKKDWVVRLAGFATHLVWGLGNAGVVGFTDHKRSHKGRVLELAHRSEFVHSVFDAYGPCPNCLTTTEYAKVHNFHLVESNHETPFVGSGHVTTFWLPFLWGIEPKTYRDFRDLCFTAAELPPGPRLRIVESELADLYLPWAKQTLGEWVQNGIQVRSEPREGEESDSLEEDLVERAVRLIWHLVSDAEKGLENPDCLNPERAITTAVEAVVGAEAHHGHRG